MWLYGQVRTGSWEEPYDDAYGVVASMILGCIRSNGGFHTYICVFEKSITIPYPYILDVILVLGDAFNGRRLFVHRPLPIRHPNLFLRSSTIK